MKEINVGMKAKAETIVDNTNVASLCDPSCPSVFSTPKLVELIECAGINLLRPIYDEDELSVGVTVDIKHMASTNIGQKVFAEVEVTEVKGIMVTLNVTAFDENQQICKGTHKRAIVKRSSFN